MSYYKKKETSGWIYAIAILFASIFGIAVAIKINKAKDEIHAKS